MNAKGRRLQLVAFLVLQSLPDTNGFFLRAGNPVNRPRRLPTNHPTVVVRSTSTPTVVDGSKDAIGTNKLSRSGADMKAWGKGFSNCPEEVRGRHLCCYKKSV